MGKTRASLGLLISLAFVAAAVALLILGGPEARQGAIGCLILFGGCALVFVGELLPPARLAPQRGGVLEIRRDRGRLVLMALGAFGFTAAMPFLWRMGLGEDWVGRVIAIAGVGLFGLGGLAAVWRAMRNRPALRLDAVGLTAPDGAGFSLPWAAIEGFELYAVHGQPLLAVIVDKAAAPATALGRINEAFGFPAFTVSLAGMAHPAQEILAAVRAAHANALEADP